MVARAALACALLVGVVATAHADRRPVAVVNLDLTGNPEASELVGKLNTALDQNVRLRRVAQPEVENGLQGKFVDEDTTFLANAHADLEAAQRALGLFNLTQALDRATAGLERELVFVSPQVAARPYAELAFVLGVAKLGEGKAAEATAAFLLVHRLAPDLKLDDALLPEIVTAYERAKEPAGTATLDVTGTGRVWIDGHELGDAPGSFDVAPGPHLVQLAGADREPRGQRVDAVAKAHVAAAIAEAPLDVSNQVYRVRAALAANRDPAALVSAVKRFAHGADVHDMIFVDVVTDEKHATRLQVQTWQESVGFSRFVDADASTPKDTLDALAPPPPVKPFEPPPYIPPVIPPAPIYQRAWFKGTVGVAVVAAIVTSIVLASREGTIGVSPAISGLPVHW